MMKKTLLAGLMAMTMTAQLSAEDAVAEVKKTTETATKEVKPAAKKKVAEVKEEHVVNKGVVPGKWTQDYQAALAYAKANDLPMLLNFTGSDWCGWCKLMEKNVFNKAEWSEYAKGSVVMVFIDFPRDKSRVPQEYVAQNEELKGRFGVRGFPTYIVLDSSGKEKIGRLGAGQTKTPASFQAELEGLLRFTDKGIEKTAATLSDEAGAEYRQAFKKMKAAKEALRKLQESTKLVEAQLKASSAELEQQMKQIRIGALSAEKKQEYTAIEAELATAKEALQAFVSTNPPRNKETQQKYMQLSKAVKQAEAKLNSF